MARNTQVKHQIRHASRQYTSKTTPRDTVAGVPSEKRSDAKANKMGLSYKQIFIFWAVTIVMMLVVFVSGFKAGKVEGAREILDQVDQQMVRLPVVRPQNITSDTLSSDEAVVIESDDAKFARSNAGAQDAETRIDFTKEEKLPSFEADESKTLKSPLPTVDVSKKEPVVPPKRFEEVYPGKNLFAPPSKNVAGTVDGNTETAESIIEPILPDIEQPQKVVKPVEEPLESFSPVPGWYVQVAAAPSKEDARKSVQKITGQGFQAKVEEASIRDKAYYRILVGPYAERKDALANRAKIKSASGSSAEPFIRQVK